jgi:hypothetical protein
MALLQVVKTWKNSINTNIFSVRGDAKQRLVASLGFDDKLTKGKSSLH